MAQQPQEGFDRSVEDACRWMRAVQERLQINDNTQGPRTALEARLRETEVCGGCGLDNPAALALSLRLRPQVTHWSEKWTDQCFSNSAVLESLRFKCRFSATRWT